jgi:nucleotidyltransferase/DNA polymerase involved in DNA repair
VKSSGEVDITKLPGLLCRRSKTRFCCHFPAIWWRGKWPKSSQTVYRNKYKPDSLDIIDYSNILEVYKRVSLLDLNGINTRFQARLNAYGIFTPMEFYNASLELLKKQVFQTRLWPFFSGPESRTNDCQVRL